MAYYLRYRPIFARNGWDANPVSREDSLPHRNARHSGKLHFGTNETIPTRKQFQCMTKIALVVLDTLRYDCFDEYFSWLDGIWFENAYSTSHWTSPAHASLLTGLYPSEVGTTIRSKSLMHPRETLPEALQSNEYTTRMVTSNGQIYAWDGWDRGFTERIGHMERDVRPVPEAAFDWHQHSESTDYPRWKQYATGLLESIRGDYSIAKSLQHGYHVKTSYPRSSVVTHERIKSMEFAEDEFLLTNIMDAHQPYYPPKKYRVAEDKVRSSLIAGLAGEVDNGEIIQQSYRATVRYLSEVYQRLYDDLHDEFDYVITLGDHGEYLGEQGLWAHNYGLGEELTHVPLVISGSEVPDETVTSVVSLLDVHQTIADLADVPVDSRGQNLLGEIEPTDRLVEFHGISETLQSKFRERGLTDWIEPMNRSLNAIAAEEGYAHETLDGFSVSGDWSEDEARSRLNDLTDDLTPPPTEATAGRDTVSDEIQSRLKDLGYA